MKRWTLSTVVLVFGLLFGSIQTAPSPAPRADEPPVYRLPEIVKPESYKVELNLPKEALTTADKNDYSGKVTITFNVAEAEIPNLKNVIQLHAEPNAIPKMNSIKINGVDVTEINKDTKADSTTSIYGMKIDDTVTITPEANTLEIEYDAILSTQDMYGLYKSTYKNEAGETKYLATTQFESVYARRVFPCFDEPIFKAIFEISVTISSDLAGYHVLGNTPLVATPILDAGTKTAKYQFKPTPIMSTYLVVIVVSDFTSTKSPVDPAHPFEVPHSVWSHPATTTTNRDLAVENGPKILNALNEYTGVFYKSFKLEKLDQVAIPDFAAGAMENWGLATYRETALLWDKEHSSNRYKQRVVTVIAHEFTHMWFGDFVTCNWWSEIFLNEGFAAYFEFHITDVVLPEWELKKQFVLEKHQAALDVDVAKSAQALQSDANSPVEISAKFGTISYGKGSSVLRMVEHVLGTAVWKVGLNKYLTDNQYGNTLPEDLWNSFTPTAVSNLPAGKTLGNVMENWVKSAGFPLVTVRKLATGKFEVTQERYLVNDHDDTTRWYVPLSYTTSVDKDFTTTAPKQWLSPEVDSKVEISAENAEWVLLNIQSSGYYRVHYENFWKEITSAIIKKEITEDLNIAAIVDDIFSLAKINKIKYPEVFELLSFLNAQSSYYTWYPAFKGFDYLLRRIGTESTLGASISDYIRSTMNTLYTTVKDSTSEEQVDVHNKVQATSWACKLKNQACIEDAIAKFQDYKTNNKEPNNNEKLTVYCYGLKNSAEGKSQEDWDFLWGKYQSTDLATEQVTILSALGCTSDEDILKAYLEKSITAGSGIRQQDALSAFTAVYTSGDVGLNIAFDFLQEKPQEIASRYASMNSLINLINGIADRFTTKEQIDKLEVFSKRSDLPESITSGAKNALDTANANLEWLNNRKSELDVYFANQKYVLPKTLDPQNYKVELNLDEKVLTSATDNTYSGKVTITFDIREGHTIPELNGAIQLHVAPKYISKPSKIILNGVHDLTTLNVNTKPDDTTSIYALKFENDEQIKANGNILEISYSAILSTTDMYGFYKSTYKTADGVTKYLATTQFQSVYARRVFPCLDETSFKATFDVTITISSALSGYHVLANTELTGEPAVDVNAKTKTYQFKQTRKMSTYLVAFIVSDFTQTKSDPALYPDQVPHSVWSRAAAAPTTHLARDESVKLLNKLDEYTGVKYKDHMPKMDQVAIPDFAAGAMENWGLATYRETALLWDENLSSNRYKQRVVTVIAHEFSHMWFGDLVTCNSWSETFLNEGFATFFEFHITDEILPDWELTKQFVLEEHQAALDADASKTALALQSEAKTPEQIDAKFGTISYSKGGSVLRMVEHILGTSIWKVGLNKYLTDNQYGNTLPEDLWKSFTPTAASNLPAGKTLGNVMENWVKAAGFPLLYVKKLETGKFEVTQERYLVNDLDDESRWYVPLSYTSSVDKDFTSTAPKQWLSPEVDSKVEISAENAEWVLLNIQSSGYYRVHYENFWKEITAAIGTKEITGDLNIAAIVDDIFSIAKINQIKYSEVFELLSFLKDDTSYYSWYPAFKGFNYLLRRVGTESTLGASISAHITTSMNKLYSSLKDSTSENQVDIHNKVQAISWACKLKNKDCIKDAVAKFQAYKTKNNEPKNNEKSTVYCYGLQNSAKGKSQEDWDFLWEKYQATDLATEQVTILSALGCTSDEDILKAYLEKSITAGSGIRQQDALSVFTAVYTSGDVGLNIAFKFLQDKHEEIAARYASMNALSNLLNGIASRFTTKDQVDELKLFIETVPELKETAESALDTANANLDWISKYKSDLENYFKKKGTGGASTLQFSMLFSAVAYLFICMFN